MNLRMRLFSVALTSLAVAACGGDNQGTGGSGGGSSSSSTETTSTGGSSTTGTTSSGGSGGTGGGSACAPADALSTLQSYLQQIHGSAGLLDGHAGPMEAVGFFLAPGLPMPPANVASYYSLVMVCARPVLYDPYCDEGKCSRLECTAADASWANHLSLDGPPKTFGGFTFQKANVDVAWKDGAAGITFDTAIQSTGPGGADWTLNGSGSMDGAVSTLQAELPSLFPGGAATLSYDADGEAITVTITVQGVTIAQLDATGDLVATGSCP